MILIPFLSLRRRWSFKLQDTLMASRCHSLAHLKLRTALPPPSPEGRDLKAVSFVSCVGWAVLPDLLCLSLWPSVISGDANTPPYPLYSGAGKREGDRTQGSLGHSRSSADRLCEGVPSSFRLAGVPFCCLGLCVLLPFPCPEREVRDAPLLEWSCLGASRLSKPVYFDERSSGLATPEFVSQAF